MAGHYRMTRGWMDHGMFGGAPYCRRAAWVWLIERAAFAPHAVRIGGRDIALKRGQLVASVRHLATEWGWKPTRVHRFLKRLEGCKAIGTAGATVGATATRLITVWNYNKYQATPTNSGTAIGTPPDSQSEQEIKKEKSVPYGTAAADKNQITGADPKGLLWQAATNLLMRTGRTEATARTAIGGLIKTHGEAKVFEAVCKAVEKMPVEPLAYMKGILAPEKPQEVAPL